MISIVVAEVDEAYLKTICTLLELEEDAVVIGQADSLESAGSILEKDPPDIFIADISWLYARWSNSAGVTGQSPGCRLTHGWSQWSLHQGR